MTLEEQFESDGNYCGNQIFTAGCVKIAEDFAIRFYNWMQDNYYQVSDGWVSDRNIDESKRTIITIGKALRLFKEK